MSAHQRRPDAAVPAIRSNRPHDIWWEAVKIRQEWLGHGLSTQPADRPAAERHLTAIYAALSRPRPRFEWFDSPVKALPLLAGLPTLDHLYSWIRHPVPTGKPPLASNLAMIAAQLRSALSDGVLHPDPELTPARKGKKKEPWPELPPLDALDAGVPLGVVLHQGIHVALNRILAEGFRQPIRKVLSRSGPIPVCWYGQQDAGWIAYYDALSRLGLAQYGQRANDGLGHWAALARSCGWWWPGDDVCIVVDRPETVLIEPVPGTWHEEVRLQPDGVRFRDGWSPRIIA